VSRPEPAAPPALPRRLLALLLPRGIRGEAILGDLEEEFRARAAARSDREARGWYRRQALRVMIGYRLRRLFSAPPPRRYSTLRDPRASSSWSLLEDVRYGARRLAKTPVFSGIAIGTIAVAVGANTAIFSVLDAVILRPLPYPGADRLVQIWETNPTRVGELGLPYSDLGVNALNYEFYAETARSFDGLAWKTTYDNGFATVAPEDGGAPESVGAMGVSANFFQLLGAQPVLGRSFLPEERAPVGTMRWTDVAVLSHDLWAGRFGADPDILGKTIRVEAGPTTVVGVLPEGFVFPSLSLRGEVQSLDVDIYFPMYYPAYAQSRASHQVSVIGRLRTGVSVEAAQDEMTVLAARLEEEYPETLAGWTAVVTPLRSLLVRDFGAGLTTLMAMVGFVLLIACANVANLLLARGSTRAGEIAVRAAIGGGRRRLAQLLLAEGLVLAALGAGLGALLAMVGTDALVALVPEGVPRASNAGLDARVLTFTAALAAAVTLLVGLAPALRFSTPDLGDTLRRRSGRRATGTFGLSRGLVTAQVALTVVLLVGGGLLGKSFVALRNVDRGIDPHGVLRVQLAPGAHHGLRVIQLSDLPGRRARWEDVQRKLRAIQGVPGVTAAAIGEIPINEVGYFPMQFTEADPPERTVNAPAGWVSPEYFEVLRVPIVRGEGLTPWSDVTNPLGFWWTAGACDPDADPWCSVLVSETFAADAWPGEDPIGQRVGFYGCCWRVAGVVPDLNVRGVDAPAERSDFDPRRRVYVPYGEVMSGFLVRTEGNPLDYAGALRSAIASVDPLAVVTVSLLDDDIAESLARPRFYSFVVGLFALVALALALVGLYGVVAYAVSGRTHEIGIRMALGARRTEVRTMILADAMWPVAAGLVIGGVVVGATVRALESLLYGMSALDPWVMSAAILGLAAVCALATLLPARKASSVDPVTALAYE